jgi:hypothetical protein
VAAGSGNRAAGVKPLLLAACVTVLVALRRALVAVRCCCCEDDWKVFRVMRELPNMLSKVVWAKSLFYFVKIFANRKEIVVSKRKWFENKQTCFHFLEAKETTFLSHFFFCEKFWDSKKGTIYRAFLVDANCNRPYVSQEDKARPTHYMQPEAARRTAPEIGNCQFCTPHVTLKPSSQSVFSIQLLMRTASTSGTGIGASSPRQPTAAHQVTLHNTQLSWAHLLPRRLKTAT